MLRLKKKLFSEILALLKSYLAMKPHGARAFKKFNDFFNSKEEN